MHVLVTGATGFIGHSLCQHLTAQGMVVHGTVLAHEDPAPFRSAFEPITIEPIGRNTPWRQALDGIDIIIHLAARVHILNDTATDPLADYRSVNVEGTLSLARQAAKAGVRRFLFISSIKVNGEQTLPGRPYLASDVPAPMDPYGISKYEAEQGLLQLAQETGLEVVIIRPVLVYGPGVKANFLTMMRWLQRGIPLPLGSIHNQRSLVALDNLVDLIVTCLHHPAAANQTLLVSDGEDLSTTALLKRTAAALGRPARLIPVPAGILRTAARLIGKTDMAQQLCGSLQVDMSKTRRILDWSPSVTVDQALKKTAQHFLKAVNETNS